MSIQSEASDEDVRSKNSCKLKNEGSPGLMTFEQIQDLIANAVKAQFEGGSYKTHLYTKPYTKRVGALCMPCHYQPPKFNNLMEMQPKTACYTFH